MPPKLTKTSYHPYLLVAFYLNCLPENILQVIPRSTRYDWNNRNIQDSYGYDWFLDNKDLFQTLQLVAVNKKLLRINTALLRVIAIKRFMIDNVSGIKEGRISLKTVVAANILKVGGTIGLRKALKLLNINFQQYANLRRKLNCSSSIFNLCKIKHPAQLLKKEIETIKEYCLMRGYQFWPLLSIYHQMRRNGITHICLSTFYKYVSLLNLNRSRAFSRRKNNSLGIRASAPLSNIACRSN